MLPFTACSSRCSRFVVHDVFVRVHREQRVWHHKPQLHGARNITSVVISELSRDCGRFAILGARKATKCCKSITACRATFARKPGILFRRVRFVSDCIRSFNPRFLVRLRSAIGRFRARDDRRSVVGRAGDVPRAVDEIRAHQQRRRQSTRRDIADRSSLIRDGFVSFSRFRVSEQVLYAGEHFLDVRDGVGPNWTASVTVQTTEIVDVAV